MLKNWIYIRGSYKSLALLSDNAEDSRAIHNKISLLTKAGLGMTLSDRYL